MSPTVSLCARDTRRSDTPPTTRTQLRRSARRRDATTRVHRNRRGRRTSPSSSSSCTAVLVEPGARQPAAATSSPARTLTATAADCRAAPSRAERPRRRTRAHAPTALDKPLVRVREGRSRGDVITHVSFPFASFFPRFVRPRSADYARKSDT